MGETETKVAKLEVKVNNHEQRLFTLESDNKALNRLAATLEQQVKISNERDEKQNKVLEKINENLTGLNSRFDHVEKRVNYLEENHNHNLININELWKTTIFKIIPSLIGGILLAWFLIQLGLQ